MNYKITITEIHKCYIEDAISYNLSLYQGILQPIATITHLKGLTTLEQYVKFSSALKDISDEFDLKDDFSVIMATLRSIKERLNNTFTLEELNASFIGSREEMFLLERVIDRLARTYMGQFDVIWDIWINGHFPVETFVKFRESIDACRKFITRQPKYIDDVDILFEMRQVMRYRRSWDEKPEGGMSVDFDQVLHYSKFPLIIVESLK